MDAATHMHNITVCIEKRHLITIYRLDKPMIGAKLDQCILKALLTGRAAQQYDPVSLGLRWGKCEKIIQNLLISEGEKLHVFLCFPPMQKQVNNTLPSYSQYDSRLFILWTIKVYGSRLTIFWAIYGSVYDQSGTINVSDSEYGQPGAIKRKLG